MTSVASYGWASTCGNYTLLFSGSMLGRWIESFTSVPRRLTEISERQNLWATTAVLDGAYPCFVWDSEFKLYCETGSLVGYLKDYFALNTKFYNAVRPLEMRYGDTTSVVINFGNCYMKPWSQEEPGDLLLQRAGMMKFKFVGTLAPTVVA